MPISYLAITPIPIPGALPTVWTLPGLPVIQPPGSLPIRIEGGGGINLPAY
jgi:hypothetical protein